MKLHPTLALLALFPTLAALANDGSLLQTGSASVSQVDYGVGSPVVGLSTTTNLFDRHGNMTQSLTWDYGEDGVPDALTMFTYNYDKHGALISIVQDMDANADGTVDSRFIYTNLTANQEVVLFDNNADGVIDDIITSTFTYANGLLVSELNQDDTNADGIPDVEWVETWTYDVAPHQISYTEETDHFSPGVTQIVFSATYVLDEDGNPISGAWSENITNFGSEVTGTAIYTYNKFGNLIQETDESLSATPSGPITSTTTTTYFYSHRGEIVRDAPLGVRPLAPHIVVPLRRFRTPRSQQGFDFLTKSSIGRIVAVPPLPATAKVAGAGRLRRFSVRQY